MLVQSGAVVGVLTGRDAGWQVQRRDDGSLPLSELVKRFGRLTVIGILLAAAAYAVSLALFFWMTPVTLGLLLAIPLAVVTARTDAGAALRKLRLLTIPEERDPPKILTRANALAIALQADDLPLGELLRRSRPLRDAHLAMLTPAQPRRRGDVDSDLAIANAKMSELETLEETLQSLTAGEQRALLSDPQGFTALLAMSDLD
jgi:membrane glycosyltransferase